MDIMYSSKNFLYNEPPETIKEYLQEQGYETKELYYLENGLPCGDPFGFAVIGTTIKLGYGTFREGKLLGKGSLSMRNSPVITGGDIQVAEQSLKLYLKLYRKFRSSSVKDFDLKNNTEI